MGTLDSFNVDENLIFAKGKPISSDNPPPSNIFDSAASSLEEADA